MGDLMAKKEDNNIGLKVKRALQNSDLTQRDLAKEMGVTHQQVSNIVRGINKPSVDFLKKTSELTGTPMDYFFDNSRHSAGAHSIIASGLGKVIAPENELIKKDIELLKKENELRCKDVELLKKEVENINLRLALNKKK
jgi:transcriptional regulator with XRE-family HTH domain